MRLIWFFIFLILPAISTTANATVYLDIGEPSIKRANMAIPRFVPIKPNQPEREELIQVRNELQNALDFTSYFNFIEPEAYLEKITAEKLEREQINFEQWSIIATDELITGGYTITGAIAKLHIRLFHVASGKELLSKGYLANVKDIRSLALEIGNDVIKALTGKPGIFDTKIAFVSDATGHKEIYMMDFDGDNVKKLTKHRSISLTPSWSPSGEEIVYTSYRLHHKNLVNPDLMRVQVGSMRTSVISDKKGLNTSGAWSPDGGKLILTYSPPRGDTDLFLITPGGKIVNQLTDHFSIDIEPSWAPDGKSIAWVSSRRGNPMVFVMNSDGTNIRRLTYAGRYNASPVWSPDGKRIAFASQIKDYFDIFIIDSDGNNLQRVTKSSGESNEQPSFSPDGRHLVYHSSKARRSNIYVVNIDGTGERCLTCKHRLGRSTAPSWSPK